MSGKIKIPAGFFGVIYFFYPDSDAEPDQWWKGETKLRFLLPGDEIDLFSDWIDREHLDSIAQFRLPPDFRPQDRLELWHYYRRELMPCQVDLTEAWEEEDDEHLLVEASFSGGK